MAAETGRPGDALALERALADDARRWDLFQLLRRLEAVHADAPRFGRARRAGDEPVRAGQSPRLTMPTGTVAALTPGEGRRPAALDVHWPGLMGPMGPLPLHLTVYARRRIDHAKDPTFARFCNVLQHRFILLFYRAWAASQPAVAHDRRADDRFAVELGALAGLAAARPEGDEGRRAHADALAALWYLRGRGPRHPAGLVGMVAARFEVAARVDEFVGSWLELPEREQTALDGRRRLGEAPVLGRRFHQVQQRFRLVLGPLDLARYLRFLPDGEWARPLWRLVRLAVGPLLEFDVRLALAGPEVPPPRLDGSMRLGLTSWLGTPAGPGSSAGAAADLVVDGERLRAVPTTIAGS
jgi:type VI secretion system protein ImpH